MPKQESDKTAEAPEESDVPASSEAQAVAARQEQSKESKRATLDLLLGKKAREREIEFMVGDQPVTMLLRAVSSQEYDRLLTKNPPTPEQRVEGAAYNINTLAPALLSRVIVEPTLSEKEWSEVWQSKDWSQGELSDLFSACAGLCVSGLQVPLP